MGDGRTERARRLAGLAIYRAQPAAARASGSLGRRLSLFRRPLSRRAADLAVRELIEAARHDRNTLLRAAALVEDRAGESEIAAVAHGLLVEAVAAVTSR